jgi:hypothetical protein
VSRSVTCHSSSTSTTSPLSWTVDDAAAGYEVVWRPTVEPVWTHVLPVGHVGTVTIPHFAKDNVLFGVRSVGADGNHSPAAFPLPG